jgi:hypothetical protein
MGENPFFLFPGCANNTNGITRLVGNELAFENRCGHFSSPSDLFLGRVNPGRLTLLIPPMLPLDLPERVEAARHPDETRLHFGAGSANLLHREAILCI